MLLRLPPLENGVLFIYCIHSSFIRTKNLGHFWRYSHSVIQHVLFIIGVIIGMESECLEIAIMYFTLNESFCLGTQSFSAGKILVLFNDFLPALRTQGTTIYLCNHSITEYNSITISGFWKCTFRHLHNHLDFVIL